MLSGICVISSILAIFTVKCFKRRTLIIYGHIIMALAHLGVAIFNIHKINIGVLIMIGVFDFTYCQTSGPVAGLYATETTADTALGLCLLTLWGVTYILSIVCPIIMGDDFLGKTNTFFLFAGLSFMGSIYGLFLMKETYGLTDKEKKSLYTPKKKELKVPIY